MKRPGITWRTLAPALAMALVLASAFARAETDGEPTESPIGNPPQAPRPTMEGEVIPGQTAASAALEFMINQQYRHRDLTTLRFEFVQKRSSRLFTSDVYTTGHVHLIREAGGLRYKIDSVSRAAGPQAKPIRSVNWRDGESAGMYVPEAQTVYLYPRRYDASNMLQTLNFMLLGFFGRTDDIYNYYVAEEDISNDQPDKARLRFTPNYPWELGGVTLLRVDFDRQTRYPERVHVEETRGDVTEIRIRNVQVDLSESEIAERLTPVYPRDVRVLRM